MTITWTPAATMRVPAMNDVCALVTSGAAENLRIAPGDKLAAFFKPSDVVLAAD